jgi:hypothetical protein
MGHGAGAQAGAGAAGHHWHLQFCTEAHQRLDLRDGFRQHSDQRHLFIQGQAIALVGLERQLIGNDAVWWQYLRQFGE